MYHLTGVTMKLTCSLSRTALLLVVALPAVTQLQAQGSAPGMVDALRGPYTEVAATIVKAAESAPEDKYGYRPTAGVRSLGELVGHLADGNNYYCRRANDEKPEWKETVALSGAGKTELLARLRESIALCTAAHNAENAARSGELLSNYGHVNHHYGNMVTYLRMLNLTPPAS